VGVVVELPSAFCWSKFGAEAGEPSNQIIRRKEYERRANDGTFLWGIGNSIRPSLAVLLQSCGSPEVLFTPMLSRPASIDVAPAEVVLWQKAVGLDGNSYEIPAFSAITSRPPVRGSVARHFALVCSSGSDLYESVPGECQFNVDSVRNLATGSPVGPSQVTSVVKLERRVGSSGRSYRVAFRAHLVSPFLVSLYSPLTVPRDLRWSEVRRNLDVEESTRRLLDLRDSIVTQQPTMTLF